MKKYLKTTKLIQQQNGLYKIEVYDGAVIVKEERNLRFEAAIERIDEIMEGKDETSS